MSLYNTLDSMTSEIRILRVKAGEYPAPIVCDTMIISLNKLNVAYRTLSYCWSDDSGQNVPIKVAGHDIPITSNLHHALDRIRELRQDVLIWVDSICINQADPVEKSQQVGMMGRIYTQCKECLVWLGTITQEPESCIKGLETLEWMAGDRDESSIWPGDRESAARGLRLFMKRPWWYRMWTVQEILLPPRARMLWGSLTISWDTIVKAADSVFGDFGPEIWFPDEFLDNGSGDDLTATVRGLSFTMTEHPLHVVWRWRSRDATDPRDKFYGLHGLPNIQHSPLGAITIDYTIDTKTLYSRVTKTLISEYELFPLIGQKGERHSIQGLPSWALDLTHPRRPDVRSIADFFAHMTIQRDYGFNADNGLPSVSSAGIFHNESVLSLKGIYIDRVAVVEIEERSDGYGDGPAAVLGSWTEAYQGTSSDIGDGRLAFRRWPKVSYYRSGPDQIRATRTPGWTRMIQEFRHLYPAGQEYYGHEGWLEDYEYLIHGKLFANNPISSSEDRHDVGNSVNVSEAEVANAGSEISKDLDTFDWSNEIVRTHLLFVTESGKFGFGPVDMKAGDQVWVLGGCRWPLVLRPAKSSELVRPSDCRDFFFRGECCVYGLMAGEATRGRLHEQVTVSLH